MVKRYNLRNIRTLLVNGFNDDILRKFCHDYFPPVYERLANGMSKYQIINMIIEYVERNSLFEILLTEAKHYDQMAYREHEPYSVVYTENELEESPKVPEQLERVQQKMKVIFLKAKEEIFEDGMESNFSNSLISLINEGENVAMEVLFDFILHEKVDLEVASETLRWMGRIEQEATYYDRLWLLEQSLYSSSARIRDSAALGLASLDDPHAIPYLKKAIEQEAYPELREDLKDVLEQLEDLN